MTAANDKPVHPVHQIENIRLEPFERAVYTRDYETATRLLFENLRRLKQGAEFVGYPCHDPGMREILYTRMAAAIVALLADPGMFLSPQGAAMLFSEHAICDMLFRASAFRNSDHLLPQMASNPAETDRTKLRFPDGNATLKFLTTYSLRSGFALNYEETFRRAPTDMFPLWAGTISTPLTISQQAHDKREALLGMHGVFADARMPQEALPSLSDAYMYTSYGTRADKHDAKATIHKLCADMLSRENVVIPALPARREIKARPRMLVCIEWFTSLHAMYRCYAGVIRQLRQRFELVALARDFAIDDQGSAEFDEVVMIPKEGAIAREMIRVISEQIKPDVIFWPSLGMEMLFTLLASVRLAPVQIMAMGHPSSSRSPCVDYALIGEGNVGDESLFTERVVYYPEQTAKMIMRPDAQFPEPLRDSRPEVVNVAVPAMLCKLNAPFMAACKAIAERAEVKTRFHFFPNTIGVTLHQAAREIRDWLPDALIYERNQYNGYLQHLNACHIHLSTFPFGGTNSVIDSLLLGKPVVSLWGEQPHSRYDGMLQDAVGIGDLVSYTHEEYIDKAVRLVNDNHVRCVTRDDLLSTDVKGMFFGQPEDRYRTAFADAVWKLYVEHPTH